MEIREDTRLLDLLHNEYIDVMHACGGKGRCTTCKIEIHSGEDLLSSRSPFEQRCLENKVLKVNERLSCQAKFTGRTIEDSVVVSIPEEYKLPHLNYS